MSDWQVGDLAVCVPCKCPSCSTSAVSKYAGVLKAGRTYTVVGFGSACASGRALALAEADNHNEDGILVGWCVADFRKIRPDEHEACEPEFVTLLKRTKHKVQA